MDSILSIAISPNCKYLVGGDTSGLAYIWLFEELLVALTLLN